MDCAFLERFNSIVCTYFPISVYACDTHVKWFFDVFDNVQRLLADVYDYEKMSINEK